MSRASVTLLAGVSFLALGGGAGAECAPGKNAPPFALRELRDQAKVVSSADLYPGKTTLLSFFATWCRPCKEEIPNLRSLAERFQDRGFQVVLVSLDRDKKDVVGFLHSAGSGTLPVLWDVERKVKDLYRVTQLPTNIRVDPDRCIGADWFGFLPAKLQELENHLTRLPKSPK
ncbi:MAG: TlpA family protein disulfide reductase [Deltaproteobacteria bacterium]|nr:TlpA family protein disulfide reductase [Deltaproteobacteria bacterium]